MPLRWLEQQTVRYEGEDREPEIFAAANASYYVRGGIEIELKANV
jgi:hypothetical protein